MSFVKQIPNALTTSRFFVAAYLLGDCLDGAMSRLFVPLFVYAGVSDVLDGILARALKAESQRGCVLDAYADIALYGGAVIYVWFLYPLVIKAHILWLAAVLALLFSSWGYSLIKFKRLTSYHTYASKAWAFSIYAALCVLFVYDSALLLVPMFALGICANTEEILITRTMPYWKGDIRGLRMALRLSRSYEKPAYF